MSASPRPNGAPNGNKQDGFKVVVVSGLTKNVHRGHLEEIFGEYGKIVGLDLPLFKVCEWASARGKEGGSSGSRVEQGQGSAGV